MITHAIRDRDTLYSSFMPFLQDGGLFIPTDRQFDLGDEVFVLLTLPDTPDRYPVTGRVVWLSPKSASGRPAGIGLQFTGTQSEVVLRKIEAQLATLQKSTRATYTM
ncbi:MAG: PilZ domain-containing protein [Candidatus Competibacterales bacterium]|nr:PilZ domain-containing protein [Candidatus Competibacterales bacterium]